MATKVHPTEKQKEKLRKLSDAIRKNSQELTVNPNYQDIVEYDDEGNLIFDARTTEGKEIKRILKSRNRSPKQEPESNYEEFDEELVWNEPNDEYDEEENDVLWEFQSPENTWDYWLGPDHDEDDEGVADWGED